MKEYKLLVDVSDKTYEHNFNADCADEAYDTAYDYVSDHFSWDDVEVCEIYEVDDYDDTVAYLGNPSNRIAA